MDIKILLDEIGAERVVNYLVAEIRRLDAKLFRMAADPELAGSAIRLTLSDGRTIIGKNNSDVAACASTTKGTNITVGEITFNKNLVTAVEFGDAFTDTKLENFGAHFINLESLNRIPEQVTGADSLTGFLQGCVNFNQEIKLPIGITGDRCLKDFLQGCISFNKPIIIPDGVKGAQCLLGFLSGCSSFNSSITIPDNITGNMCLYEFMKQCTSFNRPIVLQEGISGHLGIAGFLSNCSSMVSSVTIMDASGLQGDVYTLGGDLNTVPQYTEGVPIIGPGAVEFRERFIDSDEFPFRRLR